MFVCSPLLIYNYILTQTLHTVCGGSDANTFSEMFWGSKQHAALARLFIKCNGRQWHSKQKQGWCTSHDLRKWAGVKLDKNGNVIELNISKRKLDGKNGLTVDMLQALTELRVLNLKETSRHLNRMEV